MLGKLVHIGIDAILISAFLAGIRRSTGLTCVTHFSSLIASAYRHVDPQWLWYPTKIFGVSYHEVLHYYINDVLELFRSYLEIGAVI